MLGTVSAFAAAQKDYLPDCSLKNVLCSYCNYLLIPLKFKQPASAAIPVVVTLGLQAAIPVIAS
jgi:hypothetical protein